MKIYNGTHEGVLLDVSRETLLRSHWSRRDEPINELKGNPPQEDCPISNLHRCIEDQIKKKIAGYKSQDIKKGFYQPEQIMDVSGVLSSLVHCDFQCYYCKECVMVLYRNAREPRQWTLERLDNSKGHNRDNVVIACLQCNLTRKTMYHERFMFTKQLEIVKL